MANRVTNRYALRPGEVQRLELSWEGDWQNMLILLDGNEIGSIPNRKELEKSQYFPLEDGGTLWVYLKRRLFAPSELVLLRNADPLPGTKLDPQELMKSAGSAMDGLFLLSLLTCFYCGVLTNLRLGLSYYLVMLTIGAMGFGLGMLLRWLRSYSILTACILFCVVHYIGLCFPQILLTDAYFRRLGYSAIHLTLPGYLFLIYLYIIRNLVSCYRAIAKIRRSHAPDMVALASEGYGLLFAAVTMGALTLIVSYFINSH